MAKGKTACIICKKEGVAGTSVRDDAVLQTIRSIKSRLGILRGFTLVVCKEDLEEHRKKRENFERMAVIHATVAAILVVLFIFGPLLVGAPFNPVGVLLSLLLGLLVAGLAVLSYIPALEGGEGSRVPTPGQIVKRLMPRRLTEEGAARKTAAKTQPKKAKPYRRKKRK